MVSTSSSSSSTPTRRRSKKLSVSPRHSPVNKVAVVNNKNPVVTSVALIVPVLAVAIGLVGTAISFGAGGHDPSARLGDIINASAICNALPQLCDVLRLAHRHEAIVELAEQQIPVRTRQKRSSSAGEASVFNLEFYNRLPYSINTYWKDYEGVERYWFGMESFSYHGNISSVPGHVWVFRLASTDQILFEELIGLEHCGKIMIAPPEHIEALRQYCHETGRAILGNWPRAPLVRHIPPAYDIGSERHISTEHAHFRDERVESAETSLTVHTLSHAPHMLQINGFLSDEECDHLIELAQSSGEMVNSDVGSSMWIEHAETPIVGAITRRLFDVMGFEDDVESFFFAEKMQVTRFDVGEEYPPHFDAMDISTSQRALPHNRFATLMMYLNDVSIEAGGADVFPRADFRDEYSDEACACEMQVRPKKGKLIVLYDMLKDGSIDETALHGSCPVKPLENSSDEGVKTPSKWVTSMYLWDPFVQWTEAS